MCNACFDDEKIETKTTFTVEYKDCIIVIKNVPCLECRVCGEITFTDAVSAQLEKITSMAKTVLQEISVIDYSKFVDTVRLYQKVNDFDTAIDKAVDECIKQGVLSEFLTKHRKEIKNMCLTEFDEEKYKKIMFEDGRIFAIYELVQDGDLSLEKGAKKLEMTIADFSKAMTDNGFKIPVNA